MNSLFSFGLIALILFIAPVHRAMAQSSHSDSLRRQVIEWGANKPIAVQLKSGEKLKGRIAEIKTNTLDVQLLEQGKIVTREFRWDDLQKVSLDSREEKARKVGKWIAIGTLAGIVVIVGVALSQLD